VISGFRREVDENYAPLGHYATSSGSLSPTFRFSIPEDGGERLSRNVGKKLPLLGSLRKDT